MWKASLYSPHLPLDLIEDMTPWTSWSCIGEHFPTSVSSLIFLARPMIPCKDICSETHWHYQICTQRINASDMQAKWMLHMSRMNVVQRQDTGQQLSRASALGPWWTWCAVTSHSASASSARRRGSSVAGWTFWTRLSWAIPMWPTPTDRRSTLCQKTIKVIISTAFWREKNHHLLHLKLDGGLQVKDLDVEVVRVTSEGNFPACKKLHQYWYYPI